VGAVRRGAERRGAGMTIENELFKPHLRLDPYFGFSLVFRDFIFVRNTVHCLSMGSNVEEVWAQMVKKCLRLEKQLLSSV
jgi:hypothetical protein